jgi:hypothetical protein
MLGKMRSAYLSTAIISPLIFLFSILLPLASAAITVSNTILVFARDTTSAYSVTSGLTGYGIPYQLVIVPQAGITLPTLNASTTSGNYGGILMLSEVAYSYSTGWASALTAAQLTQLFTYQTTFGVRMVRLDAFPSAEFGMYLIQFPRNNDNSRVSRLLEGKITNKCIGTTTAIAGAGCCDAGVEQLVSISNSTGFPTANLKTFVHSFDQ